MRTIPKALRRYMRSKHGVPQNASDSQLLSAVRQALDAGELQHKTIFDLVATKADHAMIAHGPADPMQHAIDQRAKSLLGDWPYGNANQGDVILSCNLHDAVEEILAAFDQPNNPKGQPVTKQTDNGDDKLLDAMVKSANAKAGNSGHIRYVPPSEGLSTRKSVAKHFKTGQPVPDPTRKGHDIEMPSEVEFAKMGVYFKHLARRGGVSARWTDFDAQLFGELVHKDAWVGNYAGQSFERLTDAQMIKASLLDDGTSGGQEIVPEFFDRNIVTFPLLSAEVLPLVDIVSVPPSSGSSVEAASVGNPTVTWGTAEGSAITEFDATSLVAAIDTSLHPVACAIEVGNDFMSDSAVNVGQTLTQNLFQRLANELDIQIINGDGSTQPLGVLNDSTTSVSSTNGTGSAAEVADVESLIFGIGKQYRQAGMRNAFCMNDTTYKRFRAIAVSGTDDRRVFGMTHQDYMLLNERVAVENSECPNSSAIFGAWSKYRLYRREGAQARFTSEGSTLTLKNTSLLYFRARYGGQVVDSSAFAVMTDLQV